MRELTFGALALAYLSIGLQHRQSQRGYARIYQRHFNNADWGAKPLRAIQRVHVMELNQSLAAVPAHGNKIIGFIRQVYAWGMKTIQPETHRLYWEGTNPAWQIEPHKTYSRERLMDHDEIRLFLQDLQFMKNPKYKAFFHCRVLVPCRIRELCAMERAAVDPRGKWTKATTKNHRPQTTYIPHQAMAALQMLPVEGKYFFSGALYNTPLSEDAVRRYWGKWRKELGLRNLWLLDFRRTLHSYLYRVMKVDDLTAKALLNHYDSRPVAIYVKLDYDYLRDILQGYADWIWQFLKEASTDSLNKEVCHDTIATRLQSIADVCAGTRLGDGPTK